MALLNTIQHTFLHTAFCIDGITASCPPSPYEVARACDGAPVASVFFALPPVGCSFAGAGCGKVSLTDSGVVRGLVRRMVVLFADLHSMTTPGTTDKMAAANRSMASLLPKGRRGASVSGKSYWMTSPGARGATFGGLIHSMVCSAGHVSRIHSRPAYTQSTPHQLCSKCAPNLNSHCHPHSAVSSPSPHSHGSTP